MKLANERNSPDFFKLLHRICTGFPSINHLPTGKAGLVTNSEGRILDKYLARAVNGALEAKVLWN
jgi:hypothetical protein